MVQLDGVFNDSTQLVEHSFLVFAVTASVDQAGRAPDIAFVLVGPLDDLYVSRAVLHLLASRIANCTARI
jgi:hypothetical protein